MATKSSESHEMDLNIEMKQNIIISQTSYTTEEAKTLLENNNGNYMKIIRDYLRKDKPIVDIEEHKPLSLNQNIYKHIRRKMNENMDEVISRMSGNL